MKRGHHEICSWTIALLIAVGAPTVAFSTNGLSNHTTEKGAKKHGWIGVSIQNVDAALAKKKDLGAETGAYILGVVDDSPADSAGVRKGDVVVKFAGSDVSDADDLATLVKETEPGTRVKAEILRKGARTSLEIRVGSATKNRNSVFRVFRPPHVRVLVNSSSLGMELQTLNEQLAEYFGAPNGEGVLVERVEEKSAAAKAGFKAGDVITRVGKRTVNDVEDIHREIRRADEGDKVDFEVLRKGANRTLTLEIEEGDDFRFEGGRAIPQGGMKFHSFPDGEGFQMKFDRALPDVDQFLQQKEIRKELQKSQEELRESLQKIVRTAQNGSV